MLKRYSVFLLIALAVAGGVPKPAQAAQACRPIAGTDIFYVNGMRTERPSAVDARKHIQTLFPSNTVQNAYVTTHGTLKDLFEAAAQKRYMQPFPELQHIESWDLLPQAILWWTDNSLLTNKELKDYFKTAYNEEYAKLLKKITPILGQEDFDKHIAAYRESLEAGKNIILLGFSQGSIYTNHAYFVLNNLDPKYKKRIGIVDSGSVAEGGFVFNTLMAQGNGRYNTYHNDGVVNFVNSVYPSTLDPNHQRARDIGTNHHFEDYFGLPAGSTKNYVEDPNETQHFINLVREVNAALDTEICEDVPEPVQTPRPVPCGERLNQSGGSEGYSTRMTMGSKPGVASVFFEAYSIPDSLKITSADGRVLATSGGFVNGNYKASFFHKGSVNNTFVYIDVIGNSDSNTQWTLHVSCPDSNINVDSSGDIIPEIRFKIEHLIKDSDNLKPKCKTQVWLDNKEVIKITSRESKTHYITKDIGYGTHKLKHKTECGCKLKFGCKSELGSATFAISTSPNQEETLPDSCFFGCNEKKFVVRPPGNQTSFSKIRLDTLEENDNRPFLPRQFSNARMTHDNDKTDLVLYNELRTDVLDSLNLDDSYQIELYFSNPDQADIAVEYYIEQVSNSPTTIISGWTELDQFRYSDHLQLPLRKNLIYPSFPDFHVGSDRAPDGRYHNALVYYRIRAVNNDNGAPNEWQYIRPLWIYNDS